MRSTRRSTGLFVVACLALSLLGVDSAWAQRTSDFNLTVTANNRGIFTCSFNVASFDFGDVDADGTDYLTPNVTALGRNAGNNGGEYENNAGSVTWTCRAAPPSTVDIALTSTAADHTVGGMADDDLEIRIPSSLGGGISTGYQLFTSASNLLTGTSVGNGANADGGDLDLRLTVLDTDPLGANTWVVRLRASGTP